MLIVRSFPIEIINKFYSVHFIRIDDFDICCILEKQKRLKCDHVFTNKDTTGSCKSIFEHYPMHVWAANVCIVIFGINGLSMLGWLDAAHKHWKVSTILDLSLSVADGLIAVFIIRCRYIYILSNL